MAEYIEFEATKQAIDRIRSVYHRARNFNAVSVIDNVFGEIKEIPAADVAPVVRCKDCIFKYFPDEYDVCRCERTGEEIQSNDFCSHAVRKEQNND